MVLRLLLLVLTVSPVSAQTGRVVGRVVDERFEPLPGANVLVTGTLLGASTRGDGRFEIHRVPAGTRILRISMIGYETRDLRVAVEEGGEAVVPDVVLRESAVRTDEVVVTAGRRPQSFEEIPVSVAVFDARDIERRALFRLDDALRQIPGVNLTESQINVRGSSGYSRAIGTRVLLLLDGVPLLAGDAGEVKFDAVPMYMVDRIEVVKGAGSALYGSSALGGVVNVITKRPDAALTTARVHVGAYGEPAYDEWNWWGGGPRYYSGIDARHGGASDGLSYLMTVGARGNQGYRQKDDFIRWNGFGNLSWRLSPERTLGLTLNYADDDRGNWVYWRSLRRALEPPAASDLTERVRSTKLQSTITWRETVSARFAWTARGTWYRTASDTRSDTSDFRFRPSDRIQSLADVLQLDVQGTWSPVQSLLFVGGMEGGMSRVDARTYGRRSATTGAVYAQGEFKPVPRVDATVGIRADVISVEGSDADGRITPRAGIAWTPVDGTVLRGSLGLGFRAPSIAERFAVASAGGLLTKPNPDLRAERSISYELGLRQVLPLPAVLDAAVFLAEYVDLVEPVIDIDGRIVFRNITEARIAGLEAGARGAVLDGALELAASWTYLDPVDRSLSRTLKYRPRHLAHLSASWRTGAVTLGADYRYSSRVEEIDRELSLVIVDGQERVPIHVLDARVSAEFRAFDLPLTATGVVNNVLQYHYVEIVGNLAPIRSVTFMLEATW